MMGKKIRTPKEAKLTPGLMITILISAFSFAALALILEYKEQIIAFPFPLDWVILVVIFMMVSIFAIVLGLVIIKTYNRAQRVF